MKLFSLGKDGGPESHVTGFFFVEIKWLFSIVLLHFAPGSRESYHSHAFNALTYWLEGKVLEQYPDGKGKTWMKGQWKVTPRNLMHRILSIGESWAISFRGPWKKTWQEYNALNNQTTILKDGRKVVEQYDTPKFKVIDK